MADQRITEATDRRITEAGDVRVLQEAGTIWQTVYRGRNDDGDETTATWKAAQDTPWSQAVDVPFRIRYALTNPGDTQWQANGIQLEYRLNGGSWTNITNVSSVVIETASPNVVDNVATTQQITGLTGSFQSGRLAEDGHIGWPSVTIPAGGWTEVEFVLQLVGTDVTAGDTVEVRVEKDSNAVLDGYTSTPSVTVSSSAVAANYDVPLQTVVTSTLSGSVEAGANADVPIQLVASTLLAHSVAGAAGFDVPLQSVAASTLAITVAEGAGHTVPLQLVASSTLVSTQTTGADVAIPLQNISLSVLAVSVGSVANMDHAVALQVVNLATQATAVAGASNMAVPLQTLGASVTPVAVAGGAGHTVPLLTISAGLLAVLVDTGGTNIQVPLHILELMVNNGHPMTMYLVRINNGIVTRERYQVPLG